jgi:hypothetical protein
MRLDDAFLSLRGAWYRQRDNPDAFEENRRRYELIPSSR